MSQYSYLLVLISGLISIPSQIIEVQAAGNPPISLKSQLLPSWSESLQSSKNQIEHGQYTEAIKTLEALQALDNNWEIHFWLGTAYLLEGEFNDAAQSLDNALRQQSEIADIWVQRAIVEQERNNPSTALQLLSIAQQVDPSCAKAYLNAAYVYEQNGEFQIARDAYIHFLKLSSQDKLNRHLREQILSRLIAPSPNKLK